MAALWRNVHPMHMARGMYIYLVASLTKEVTTNRFEVRYVYHLRPTTRCGAFPYPRRTTARTNRSYLSIAGGPHPHRPNPTELGSNRRPQRDLEVTVWTHRHRTPALQLGIYAKAQEESRTSSDCSRGPYFIPKVVSLFPIL